MSGAANRFVHGIVPLEISEFLIAAQLFLQLAVLYHYFLLQLDNSATSEVVKRHCLTDLRSRQSFSVCRLATATEEAPSEVSVDGELLQNCTMLSFRSYLQSFRLHSGLNYGVQVRWRRELSTSDAIKVKDEDDEKIVAAVLFERLPVILPKLHPVISTFREFAFQWQHQYRRIYPDEFLEKSVAKSKEDSQIDFIPAPRVTEADKSNDRRSLQRALDRRLYLLIHGIPYGASKEKPIWHFPEKLYTNEETLRKCAEFALESVIGGLSNVYFVGNAPCGHLVMQSMQSGDGIPSHFKQFFFKSQVIGSGKYTIGKCDDYVWVSKDELLEYFEPEQQPFLQKMLIH